MTSIRQVQFILQQLSESERRQVICRLPVELRFGLASKAVHGIPFDASPEWAHKVLTQFLDQIEQVSESIERDPMDADQTAGGGANHDSRFDSTEQDESGVNFEFTRFAATFPAAFANLIRDELPITIATIASCLPPSVSARLLAELSDEIRIQVARNIAEADLAERSVLREIESAVVESLDESTRAELAETSQESGIVRLQKIFEAGTSDQRSAIEESIHRATSGSSESVWHRSA